MCTWGGSKKATFAPVVHVVSHFDVSVLLYLFPPKMTPASTRFQLALAGVIFGGTRPKSDTTSKSDTTWTTGTKIAISSFLLTKLKHKFGTGL